MRLHKEQLTKSNPATDETHIWDVETTILPVQTIKWHNKDRRQTDEQKEEASKLSSREARSTNYLSRRNFGPSRGGLRDEPKERLHCLGGYLE